MFIVGVKLVQSYPTLRHVEPESAVSAFEASSATLLKVCRVTTLLNYCVNYVYHWCKTRTELSDISSIETRGIHDLLFIRSYWYFNHTRKRLSSTFSNNCNPIVVFNKNFIRLLYYENSNLLLMLLNIPKPLDCFERWK